MRGFPQSRRRWVKSLSIHSLVFLVYLMFSFRNHCPSLFYLSIDEHTSRHSLSLFSLCRWSAGYSYRAGHVWYYRGPAFVRIWNLHALPVNSALVVWGQVGRQFLVWRRWFRGPRLHRSMIDSTACLCAGSCFISSCIISFLLIEIEHLLQIWGSPAPACGSTWLITHHCLLSQTYPSSFISLWQKLHCMDVFFT